MALDLTREPGELPFVGRSFYGELGITLTISQKTLMPVIPSSASIEKKWLQAISETHPLQFPAEEAEWQTARFCVVMEAGLTLLDPVLSDSYSTTLCSTKNGHATWLRSDERRPYTVDPLPDWMHIVGEVLLDRAQYDRGKYDTALEAMGGTKTFPLPAYVPGERLVGCRADFDVGQLMEEVLTKHSRVFVDLRIWLLKNHNGICWTWRAKAWTSQGAVAIGQARKLSDRDRARAPGTDASRPHGEIQLALNYWLVADAEERERLLFHELLHFEIKSEKLGLRCHTVEAFPEEVDAYGITTEGQAELVAAAIQHEDSAERLESFGVLPDDQLVLFRDLVEGAVALNEAV